MTHLTILMIESEVRYQTLLQQADADRRLKELWHKNQARQANPKWVLGQTISGFGQWLIGVESRSQ